MPYSGYSAKIFLFLVLSGAFTLSYGQMWRHSVFNYGSAEYGKSHDVQNWAALQDTSGLLYFANANGVLEYDGHQWEFIPCVRGVFATALACDNNGVVYVGTQYGFGYLIPDIYGKLQYFSISDSIIEQFFNTIVWKIHIINNHVYFQTEDAIFDFYEGNLYTILPKNSFHLSFVVDNELYAREREAGLMKLKNNKFELIPDGEVFQNLGVFGLIKLDNQQLMAITQEQGLFLYNGKQFHKIDNQYSEQLINSAIYGAIKLYDGNIALYTLTNGIIIVNQDGSIVSTINSTNSALHVNDLKHITTDKQGNIWCATNNGISVIYYASPLAVFKKESGVLNNVYSMAFFENKLYAGTSAGLLVEKSDNSSMLINPGYISNIVWALLPFHNELIIGENDHLYSLQNNNLQVIEAENARSLCYLSELNLLLSGGKNGVTVYESKNGKWLKKMKVAEVNSEIISLAYDKYQNNQFTIWAGTQLNGVYAISIDDNLEFNVINYPPVELSTDGYCLSFNIGKQVIIGTNNGLVAVNYNHNKAKYNFPALPVSGYEIFKPVTFVHKNSENLFIALTDDVLMFRNGQFFTRPLAGVEVGKIRTM